MDVWKRTVRWKILVITKLWGAPPFFSFFLRMQEVCDKWIAESNSSGCTSWPAGKGHAHAYIIKLQIVFHLQLIFISIYFQGLRKAVMRRWTDSSNWQIFIQKSQLELQSNVPLQEKALHDLIRCTENISPPCWLTSTLIFHRFSIADDSLVFTAPREPLNQGHKAVQYLQGEKRRCLPFSPC